MLKNNALIALGANLPSKIGPPYRTLTAALHELLTQPEIRLDRISRFFSTPAFPAGAGPDYVNACARLQTSLQPEALLALLHEVEARLGRRRDGGRWGARVIDLDLLAMEDMVRPDAQTARRWRDLAPEKQQVASPDQLILPHPRLHERGFVLMPLADIAGDWRHPALGLNMAEMLAGLAPAMRAEIRPVTGDEVVANAGFAGQSLEMGRHRL